MGGALTTGQIVKQHINVNEGVSQLNKASFALSNRKQITHRKDVSGDHFKCWILLLSNVAKYSSRKLSKTKFICVTFELDF